MYAGLYEILLHVLKQKVIYNFSNIEKNIPLLSRDEMW